MFYSSAILHNLKFDLGHFSKWFKVNSLKPNPGEFQFMMLGTNRDTRVNLFLHGYKIEKLQKVVILRITIDDKLSFKTHIENICPTVIHILHALQRMRKYLSTAKAKTLYNVL